MKQVSSRYHLFYTTYSFNENKNKQNKTTACHVTVNPEHALFYKTQPELLSERCGKKTFWNQLSYLGSAVQS